MNYKDLFHAADLAINKLDEFIIKFGSSGALESIKQQMIFIRNSAGKNKNPLTELSDDRKFTYRILASKELASPEELELKAYIDRVSIILESD